jgi:hypothetical protein
MKRGRWGYAQQKTIYKNSISRKSEVEKASESNTDLFLKAHDKDTQLHISGLDRGFPGVKNY